MTNQQMVLPFHTGEEFGFDGFFKGENAQLINELKKLIRGQTEKPILYLWGQRGCGKTHLLNSCCSYGRDIGLEGVYLPIVPALPTSHWPQDISSNTVICLDDIDHLADNPEGQKQILFLYEKIAAGKGAMIASASGPIHDTGIGLRDLTSRLSVGGVFHVKNLNDDNKKEALKSRADMRGFHLGDPVLDFMLTHYKRDTASLFQLLDKIDSASLAQKRKVTIPLIKTLIET